MIDAVDVYVVDVQEQVAIGFFKNRVGELDFCQRRIGWRVVGNVFNRHFLLEYVLRPAYSSSDVMHGFFGERDWHQVV